MKLTPIKIKFNVIRKLNVKNQAILDLFIEKCTLTKNNLILIAVSNP